VRGWIIRGGEGNRLIDEFIDAGVIGLGYPSVPDARRVDRWDIERILEAEGSPAVDLHAAMLISFVHEVVVGDAVIMPDTPRGDVVIGVIAGPYEFHPEIDPHRHRHRRRVEWLGRHPRNELPAALHDLHRQRVTLRRVDVAALDEHLRRVRSGELGRPAADRRAPRAPAGPRAPRSPRAPRASRASAASTRVAKAEIATRRCVGCFQTKPTSLFDGDDPLCRDCA
jgi:hypothetical protein